MQIFAHIEESSVADLDQRLYIQFWKFNELPYH